MNKEGLVSPILFCKGIKQVRKINAKYAGFCSQVITQCALQINLYGAQCSHTMRSLYMQYFLTTPNTHLEENVSIAEELKTN